MQASARLEGVVKVEIQARKESALQLRAESLQQAERIKASVKKVDQKVEVVLGAQRMLHSHHETLQVHLDSVLQHTLRANVCYSAGLRPFTIHEFRCSRVGAGRP